MTTSEALAKIYETYIEEELFNFKDEPDTETSRNWATVITLYGSEGHATRARVKCAFHDADHGKHPADALANARRVLGLDEIA